MTRRPSPTFQVLRQNRLWISRFLAVFMALWQIGQPLQAATFYWDADTTDSGNTVDGIGLGGTGAWDTATPNWWPVPAGPLTIWGNTSSDIAIFSGSYALPPTLNTVTLSTGIMANQLRFNRGGYTLTGGDLTLSGTTPTLYTSMGESATIESQLLGSAGLTKTGGGSVRLTNVLNGYTGTTAIQNGSLIINSEAALGGTGAVSILTTNNTPSNTSLVGFGGGSLVLDGTASGFTFSRAINFEGRGPIGDRGAAIQSLGNNTLSGVLTSAVSALAPATLRNSRINSVNGTLTISGTLNVGGTLGTTITNLGGVNTAGVNHFSFAGGTLAGTGTLEKNGAGVLDLNGNASTFTGQVRIGASSIGQQSSARVTQTTVGGTSVFGASTGTTTSAAIDLNAGVLEFRSDSSLNFGVLSTGKNVYTRSTGIIFTGPAAGGFGVNEITTLGALHQNASGTAATNTTTFNSRNGFGVTLSTLASDASTSTTSITTTLTSNMGGNLAFTGNLTMPEGSTASRPRVLAIGGTGNTVVQGSVIAGTDAGKTLTKSGTGNLTIQGLATTVAGTISITAGTITAGDFRSLNNNTASISLGNATTVGGNLIIGVNGVTATAAGLTTSKPIFFNNTTAQSSIYANQGFAAPVILNGAVTTVLTTGNYNLGGSSTQDNIINTALPVAGTGGLTKVGAGTWVLNAANLYTGATTIQGGTLKLRGTAASSNVILETATNLITFTSQATAQTAGGTLEFQGFAGAATTETLGALTPTAGAATVRLLNNGASVANLTFTSLGATTGASSVNFITSGAPGGAITLTGQTATTATNLPGTANFQGHLYINGADFATTTATGVVQAPTYAAAGNFQNAGAALVAAVHNRLTVATASGAATVSSLLTNNQTLTLSGNLVVSTGGILQSGGTASILSDSATARLIQGTAAATNVAIRVNQLADVLNLGNATNPVIISGTTTAGLTKNGAGNLVIFGTNLQTGTTTINEGKVSLNGAAARLSATTANLVVRQGATLDLLAGVTAANAVVVNVDGVGTISGQSGQTFTQNGGGTWNGVYSGTGFNITKGGGAATWSGVSTYTGVTTIGGTGLVTVDTMANGGVGSGIGASTSAATNLVFTGSPAAGIDYRGSIIDTALTLGSRSATTDRLFTLAAAASGANLTSSASNNNAIVWSNTGAIVNNTTANATLTLAGASTGDNTLNPQLVDSSVGGGITLAVTKSGAGQWNLGNASNSYTGLTTISDGILGLNVSGALPSGSPLVLGTTTTSGILQASGSFARDLSTTPTAGTGTITWGGTTGSGGFAAHSTALTVTLNSGAALTWGSGGFVGTGGVQSLILNSVSSLADVTFTNAIDLGGLARTVTVNDNAQTGADYANLTGVLSGTGGGLFKNGTGILRLGNQNSYTGITSVDAGTLVVSSLGSSTAGVTSSVGAGTVTMDDTNAIVLGNATTTGGNLQYVGPGETSDRKIRLRGTTANSAIYADGAGPLILTNVAHDTTETGAKTLSLRGTNTSGNMITSVLSNNGAGVLTVSVDGGAAWILTNAGNTYTGGTSAGAGALGIGDDLALGTGSLTNTNGNVFAYGADRTIANALAIPNNVSSGWLGDYSLTVGGITTLAAAANNITFNNSIVAGKALTLNGGVTANALTANRAWIIDGPGETAINGNFTTSTPYGVRFDVNGGGTLTLGTNGATSNFNQSIIAVDVDRGTLKFTSNNSIPNVYTAATPATTAGTAIAATTYTVGTTAGLIVGQTFTGTNVPAGSRIVSIDSPTTFTTNAAPTTAVASGVILSFFGSGGVTLTPELATLDTATLDLNGTTQTLNAFTATSDGTSTINNSAASAATLIVGAGNTAATFGTGGVGTYSITQTGGGAIALTKIGTSTANFTGTLGNTGTTTVNGGVLNYNSATATTSLNVGSGGTLNLKAGLTTPANLTSVILAGGGSISFADNAGTPFANLTALSLGLGSGISTLELEAGDLGTDTLTLLSPNVATTANTINLLVKDFDITSGNTYNLLVAPGGGLLTGGGSSGVYTFSLAGYTGSTLFQSDTLVSITAGTLITSDVYWAGATSPATTSWNTIDGSLNSNFSTNLAGTIQATTLPGKGQKVIFQADNLTGGAALSTTLDQPFKINALEFRQSTTAADTSRSITIASGVGTNSLTIVPTLSTDGIKLQAGGSPLVAISAPVVAGVPQTWTTTDSVALTGGSTVVGTAVTVADTTGLRAGMTISGVNIPAGATIVSVDSATTFTLSVAATAIGAAQNFYAAQQLNLSGGLSGAGNVTKAGSGKVVLSGGGTGFTGNFAVNGGIAEATVATALGGQGSIAGSGAAISVNSGGTFYYNNATADTGVGALNFPNPITLNGGTLSAGGNTRFYSGPVTVSADSSILMRDLANSTLTATNRNITLTGVISGAGKLTVDGVNTGSPGNQITSTLVLTQANPSWSGGFKLLRGTIDARQELSLGTGAASAEFGRILFKGANGTTWNQFTNGLTLDAASGNAFLEVQPDNQGTTSLFTTNIAGTLTLGGSGAAPFVRVYEADALSRLTISGPVVLAANASIHTSGAAVYTNATAISGVISESGGARTLTLNGDTAWGSNNYHPILITGNNTYTGGTNLQAGTLIVGHVNALSTGGLTITGTSTLQAGVDLSAGGSGPLPNTVTLTSGSLTISGTNNLTTGGLVTGTGADADRTLTSSITGPATLVIAGGLNLGGGANTVARTLTLAGTGLTTVSSAIVDGNAFANNLTVTNTGTTTLTNTNTYTGTTTMNGAAGTLVLQSSNASAGATTLTAGTIRLDNASNGGLASGLLTLNGGTLQAATALRSITNPVTIAAASTVSGPQSITWSGGLVEATGGNGSRTLTNNLDAGQILTITGTVNVGATGTSAARIFTVAGTGDTSITGAMVNNTAFAHVLTKTGTGTLTLSNAGNAYTGGTNINSGTVRTGASNVIPNTGTVTVNATTAGTALFDLNGNSETIAALTLGGTGGLATSINQVTTGAGTLTLGGTVTVTSTGNFTTPALISGNLGLGAARTFTIGDSTGSIVDLDVQAVVSGAFAITKNGQGTLQLSGNNTFNGSTTVTDGQLLLDYTTNNTSKIAAAAGLVVGGATNELNPTIVFNGNASAPTTQAFTTLTVNAGSNNFSVISNGGQAANVNFTTITRATGGTVDFNLPASGNITTTQPLANGILGGYATLNNGTAFASKDGSNNLVAATSAVKDDVTTWLATDNVVDSAGFINSLLDCTTVNSITFSAAAPSVVTSIGRFGINSGGILVTSSSTAPSITGGTLLSGTGDIIVNAYSAADLTIASAIRGATSVTKTGTGAVVLAGSNTSTGPITITEGVVKVSGGNGIGDAAAVSFKNIAGSGLQLLSNETVGSIAGGGTLGGNIALGTNTLTINTNTGGTYAGVFTGSASSAIVRNGTSGGGNLTLTGASGSGFTGTVTLNGGLTFLDGLGSMDASSITVNKGASFLISNNGGTRSSTRLLDTASIILNSADGAWNSETRPSGLAVRTDQNATTSETIGVLSFASGASYFRGDASGTTGVAGILTSNFTRSNSATLDARGRALGGASGDRNQLRIVDATNQTNFINALVGGAGVAGTKNVSIVPWAFGESTAGTLADANMGNSLVTYVSGTGIRPLDLVTEYNTFGGAPAVTDNIRESLAADLTGIGGNTINALVINNSNTATGTVNVTGTGAGQTLAVTSGTMLFTSTAAVTGAPAMGITLGGFDGGITVGSTNEYVVFVQNPTSAAAGGVVTATISSPLTSAADITKSGRGALVLSGTNTAGGGTRKTTLNEGVLEISSLTNIGGSTGNLVFAGGTLRLGTTLVDDISTRTTTFLQGGGTIDTNGVNLTLANSVGSGVGGLTKTGTGNLTLNAPSTYTGGTTVLNGTLTTGVANAFPATNSLTVNGASAAVNLGTANQTLGVVTLTAGAINGTATLTSSDLQLGGGTIASTVILAGTTGLTKTTTGVVTLAGANTFTGQTLLTNGEISFNSIANADGTASALGAPTTATAGAIQMGLGANATALTYTGSGHATNRAIDLVGATGSSTINANGTGALVLNGAITSEEYGAKSIVLSGTSAGAIINKVTVPITECFGVLTLQKAGSNTWQLDATNTYTGATQLDDGKLTIAAVQNLTGGLTLGSTNAVTTAGTLDITANTTFGGPMVVQTNSASNTNHLNIAAGSTLTVNNNVTIGSNAGNSTTLLDSSGGGTFNVTNPAANGIFAVGGNTATGNQTIADLGGLGSLVIALDPTTGIVRVNPNNATNIAAKDSTLILPSTGAGTTTITANILAVGDGGQNASATQLNKVKLGSGLNTLNVNTVNIGTGTRDIGEVSFNGAAGSVVLRAADGVSRVAFNMGTGAATTGVTGALGNTFDVTGHNADLLLGAVNIGTQNRNSDLLNTFAFNQGTLDMTSLNASSKGANGNTTTTNINLGGGTVTSGAWTLASNTGPGTAVANANITGGVVTLSGNISRGVNTGAGTATATVTLAGGTLNMGGNNIGSLTAPVAFVAQSGSVSGLAELNGGGALTKTTTGTLIMRAGNNYTGATNVSDGTLQVGVGGVGTTGTGLVTAVKTGASYTNAPIISGSGSINGAVVIGDTVTAGNRGILAPGDGNTTTSNATLTITAAGGLTIAAGSQTQLGITAASGTDVAFALSGLSASAYLASLGSTSDASLTTPAAWANQPTSGQADFIKINNGAGALVLGTNGGGAAATQGIVSIFSNGLNTGSLAAGQIFNLVDWFGTFSGGFNLGSGLTQGGVYGDFDLPDISMTSFNWDTSAFKSHGVIAVVGVVPEPSRAMLMLLGLLALGFRRRRIQD